MIHNNKVHKKKNKFNNSNKNKNLIKVQIYWNFKMNYK